MPETPLTNHDGGSHPAKASHWRRRLIEKYLPCGLLVLLVAGWTMFGAVLIPRAPFASGTDESIGYVAFAAATKRWATAEDFRRYKIDHFYYPPLYFLCFAPFFGYHPNPPGAFPQPPPAIELSPGRYSSLVANYPHPVAPELRRLYLASKYFSLALGLVVICATIVLIRKIQPGPLAWWRCLLGAVPILTLPQFLYYSTLCNNDSLCNALGAGTFLAFSMALLGLDRKSHRSFLIWSGLCAVFAGLNFLTKTTAIIFVPLLIWLGLSPLLLKTPWRARLRHCAALLGGLGLLTIASGGWWLLYKALQGDWNSQAAHRLAHPWAFIPRALWEIWGWPEMLLSILRSYFSLMGGPIQGIPDVLFLLYLVAPVLTVCAGAVALFHLSRRVDWREGIDATTWLYLGAIGTIVANVAAVLLSCGEMVTPYGRLLFPTLAPALLLFVSIWHECFRKGRVVFVGLTAAYLVYATLLFSIMARERIIPAIEQKAENTVPLSFMAVPNRHIPQIWNVEMEQPMLLPAGKLQALRLKTDRSRLPEIGATIEGELLVPSEDPTQEIDIPLEPCHLGDNDATLKWTELRLTRELELTGETRAILRFHAIPPALWGKSYPLSLVVVKTEGFPRLGKLQIGGKEKPCCICVAAVYGE